jgi:hypothetical protein
MKTEDNRFVFKVAKTVEETCTSVEAGYGYVTKYQDEGV